MKFLGFFSLLLMLTACSQNVGFGIGVTGVGVSGNSIAATQIGADSETGIHGNVSMGVDTGL